MVITGGDGDILIKVNNPRLVNHSEGDNNRRKNVCAQQRIQVITPEGMQEAAARPPRIRSGLNAFHDAAHLSGGSEFCC